MHFSEGQSVHKGQPLFTLDPRPFKRRSNRRRPSSRATRPRGEAGQASGTRTSSSGVDPARSVRDAEARSRRSRRRSRRTRQRSTPRSSTCCTPKSSRADHRADGCPRCARRRSRAGERYGADGGDQPALADLRHVFGARPLPGRHPALPGPQTAGRVGPAAGRAPRGPQRRRGPLIRSPPTTPRRRYPPPMRSTPEP